MDEVVTNNRFDFTQVTRQDVNQLISGSLPASGAGYFPASRFTALQSALRGNRTIAGLMPAILEQGSAADGEAKLAHANVSLLAIPPGDAPGFAPFKASDGSGSLRIADLAPTEVYVNQAAARLLGAGADRLLRVYLPPPGSPQNAAPAENDFTVRAVVANGALGGLQPTIFIPLAQMQQRRGRPNEINEILIVNRGGSASVTRSPAATLALRKLIVDPNAAEAIRQAIASDDGRSVLALAARRLSGTPKSELLDLQRTAAKGRVTDHLIYLLGDPEVAAVLRASARGLPTRGGRAYRTLRRLNPLTVVEVKQGALDQADQYGGILTSIFVVLGLFSIAAGVLLVFLIFVMLAAERQVEMGMARAIGMRRWHLIQAFIFEGIFYDLASTVLGVGIGIGVSRLIVTLVARTLAGFGIPVDGGIQFRSIVIAFCLGALVTFATVVISAWRVSRFNIVAAIHGLPSPPKGTERAWPRFGWGGAALFSVTCNLFPIAGGYLLMFLGQQNQEYVLFALGVSLLIGGGALLLRRALLLFHAPAAAVDRGSASLAGLGLIVFWALPPSFFDRHGQRLLIGGMETFSLAGIMMVLGAVLIVACNL
ncbi:MAG TPA: FtsX-like permease family protein, partial [Steroidobacteraceae bacterium]|nr:FtsX-like permease family protein [Steroidobacteraceae bacterium]